MGDKVKNIILENIIKDYSNGKVVNRALDDVTLKIKKGDYISIIGKSGSGKTSLLRIIGCLDKATRGKIMVDGKIIDGKKEREMFRGNCIAYVFQFFKLISTLNVEDNIVMPQLINGEEIDYNKLNELLIDLDICKIRNRMPYTLSGGEKQRVAIARAVLGNDKILLADEPTGNLDSGNTKKVMDIFSRINEKYKQTIVVVTHDSYVAKCAKRRIEISDGKIISDEDIKDE